MWNAITVDTGQGRSLHALQTGTGPDLVLIHGALATHHDWREGPADALAKTHRVTIVDRPGHGASERPRFLGTPRDQAEQIAAGLTRLKVERAVVVGHSFGALVALALAERLPARVAGLVLVSPLVFPEPRLLEHSFFAPRAAPLLGPLLSRIAGATGMDRMMLERVQRDMFAPAPVPAAWKESFPYERVLDSDVLVAEGEDAAAILPMSPAAAIDLRRVAAPVRIVAGTGDRIVSHERQGKALARSLQNADIAEIVGAGHMLHHSHPEHVLAAVREVTAGR